ncbi:hypothetical protein HanIR_Chr08g0366101 [Helianthus annuus]|nr:hypothetical protein HanIR_Chr08g0366101 [Helianthus annuus]
MHTYIYNTNLKHTLYTRLNFNYAALTLTYIIHVGIASSHPLQLFSFKQTKKLPTL